MSFTLKFETDNDAFRDPQEVIRILEAVTENASIRIPEGPGGIPVDGIISDINGNKVGEWVYEPPTWSHEVTITVKVVMTEMDNSDPEASAEIALGIVTETLEADLHGFESAEVASCGYATTEEEA